MISHVRRIIFGYGDEQDQYPEYIQETVPIGGKASVHVHDVVSNDADFILVTIHF